MSRGSVFVWKIVAIAALLVAHLGPTPLPSAQATGSHVWWVAVEGTAATPATGGSSCANPSFVGATDTPLQAAIDAAASGDEIRLCSGAYPVGNTISITKSLTITGEGSALPILDGGNQRRIMSIGSGGLTVTISGVLFRNARITGGSEEGAAIDVHPATTFTVTDSHFARNTSVDHHGGAISMLGDTGSPSNGSLTVLRSTFYLNRAVDGGAIVMAGVSGQSTVRNSTFIGNHATRAGGAISASFANLTASHSTFIDNTNGDNGFTSATWIVTMIGNVIAYSPSATPSTGVCSFSDGDVPIQNVSTHSSCLASGQQTVSYESLDFGQLALWGSRVPTMDIGASSSAINAVSQAGQCTGIDQRGQTRSAASCDAGAFEYEASFPSIGISALVPLLKGRTFTSPTFSPSGLTAPVTYRVATEVSDSLPSGVSLSGSGVLSGTPTESYSSPTLIVVGTDANNVTASVQILDNCVLPTQNGKYLIGTTDDLEVFRVAGCGTDASYLQTSNINWGGAWFHTATAARPFKGTFDGGGRSLTGLQITADEPGFIPFTQGATITNARLQVTVSGGYGSAGVARLARSTTIDGVRVTGTVSISTGNASQGCLGGLAGETLDGTIIRKSSFTGTVDGPNSAWNGGLIGCAYEQSVVETSYFDGSLTGSDEVGGLIGWMERSEIRDSYSIGSVAAGGDKVGGLVGWLDLDSSDADNVSVLDSYASMQISGNNKVGALVGEGQSTTIETSYWEAGLTGVSGLNPIGSLTDQGGTQPSQGEVTPAAMKTYSHFANAGWNIETGWADSLSSPKTWGICDTSTRPFLLWQHAATPCAAPSNQSPPPNNSTPPQNDSTTTTTTPAQSTTTTAPEIPTTSNTTSTTTPARSTTTTAPEIPTTSTTTSTTTPANLASERSPTTTTSVPTTPVKTSGVVRPNVATGGIAVFAGPARIESSLEWTGNSTINGRIGDINLSMKFSSKVTALKVPAHITAGSSFLLILHGLKAGSETVATIFSEPTSLGTYTASSDGTLRESVRVPRDLASGSHRLRLEMVDQNGQSVTLWLGLRVRAASELLPATGYAGSMSLIVAIGLLLIGVLVHGTRRQRSRMNFNRPRTE